MSDVLKSLLHPTEVQAMFQLKFGGKIRKPHKEGLVELAKVLSPVEFCYEVLNRVSRSFAVVIQQLPERLKDCVCIFYLVLRGLDSVEDDMTLPNDRKLPLLLEFHNILFQDGWTIQGVGDGPDYRILLAHFDRVITVMKGLDPKYQAVIKDITRRMGAGMADFAKKTTEGCERLSDYNLYCHYVAGLVGQGLSGLFSASGLEDPELKHQQRISNSMGLFLQKTNIIRDYLEDLVQGRTWWPREIWGEYGSTLASFRKQPSSKESLACLNHMVMDALEHVPDCIDYMARIRDKKVFEFCGIPQVMAIATLAECYNNKKVFTSVVKVRKGLSCKMMLNCSNMDQLRRWFAMFTEKLQKRIPRKDPNAKRTQDLCTQILGLSGETPKSSERVLTVIAAVVLLVCLFLMFGSRHSGDAVNTLAGRQAAGSSCSCEWTTMAAGLTALAYLGGAWNV